MDKVPLALITDEEEVVISGCISLSLVKVGSCFQYFVLKTQEEQFLTEELAKFTMKVLEALHKYKIPYNLIICRNSLWIIPRKHQNGMSRAIYFGFFEFLGIVIDYECLDEYKESDYYADLTELKIVNLENVIEDIRKQNE